MLFSTGTFWLFFPAVLALLAANRLVLRSVAGQNAILLAASYVFYGWWDWRFLGLIALSTLIDYLAALGMERAGDGPARRRWLHLSILANLSILGFFKYFGFFSEELRAALTAAQVNADWGTLDIVLPVGISFYTLQTLSYSIDVYKRRAPAERDLLRYAVYVAFFPQLVAGPIERARALIPQFARLAPWGWEAAYTGVRLVIAGLFLKVVIADNLAPYVDAIWADAGTLDGGALLLGMLYFAIQIYADFAGYSSIAIGLAAIMGFRLSTNFATPFLASSISALWRGWNITLTMFFRDYVYAEMRPQAKGAPRSEARIAFATIATFFVSGLWHGANWTFIAWGTIHGVLLAAERQWRRFTSLPDTRAVKLAGWAYAFGTFFLLAPFFRSPDIGHALAMYSRAVAEFGLPETQRFGLVFVALSFAVDLLWRGQTRLEQGLRLEWLGRAMARGRGREIAETVLFAGALILVLVNAATRPEPNAFIYFQF
ncbi:MBOAT family protein [Erythrobacter sp. HL-111]|uniref:MBOAT family O-acyltransferase n=1 Tax=Erythrobacter sp. HL-111 TaxID=1798193 RepID=UPI0006DB6087|nr:MBOAT family O-acyltransferase [Erythrobacter sp. HL-111]KPP95472.1 MAG: putative membrane protein involved in D-alanine export [Erythrobacteraceae bacterium HL-111]SDS72183.1 D-alanyl-lipoteichoic acid acyltransferase DltB, MBOAT superfamily [Erythrobacter sp. HL-111]